MKTLRFYGTLLMAVLFASLVACSESSDSEEPDTTVKPDTPVSEGDYRTVSPDGATLKRGDIAINFPSGTFSSDVKVAVTKAQADKVTFADPMSDFYQITLPKEGTHRTIKLSLKCEDSPQNAVMLLQQQGWDIHTGEKKTIVIPMDTKVVGNTLETEIKELDPTEDNDIRFTVGLAKDMFASTTRADAAPADSLFSVTYDMGKDIWEKDWWISFTGKYSSRKNDMIRLVSARLPTIFQKLKDNGYKMIDHKLKYIITAMSNCGEYSNSCLASSWGVVYLSVSDLYECAGKNAITDNVDRTLIHETLHAIYDNMYDKRWAWTKSKTGEKGDEWAMLDEAVGCWSEKLIGGSINSEITRKYGPMVMASFFPQKREYLYYRYFGYGLATFIEYLSLKTSNQDIVDLYEYRRKEGTKVYNAYDAVRKFLLEKNINFFSTEGYKDYAISTLCAKNGGGMNFWIVPEYSDGKKITSLSTVTDNSLVYNYGVAVKSLQYDTKNQEIKKAFIDDGKLIQVNQNKEGLTTYVYAQKSITEYVCLGTATKDNPAQVEGKSVLNECYGKIAIVTMKSNQQVVDDDKGISQGLVVEYIEQEEDEDDWDVGKIKSIQIEAGMLWQVNDNPIVGTTLLGFNGPFLWAQTDNNVTLTANGKGLHVTADIPVAGQSEHQVINLDIDDMTSDKSYVTGLTLEGDRIYETLISSYRPCQVTMGYKLSLKTPMPLIGANEYYRRYELYVDKGDFSSLYGKETYQLLDGKKETIVVNYEGLKNPPYKYWVEIRFDN